MAECFVYTEKVRGSSPLRPTSNRKLFKMNSNSTEKNKQEKCAIDIFLEKEKEKPFNLRSNLCLISCNCNKCSIRFF